jgi:hypothetical protein
MTSPPTLPDWALQTYEWAGFTNGNTGQKRWSAGRRRPVSRHFVTSQVDVANSA